MENKDLTSAPAPIALQAIVPIGDFPALMEQARNWLKFQDEMKKIAISLTSQADWIDENKCPYLMWQGTAKVARGFGVDINNVAFHSEPYEDARGKYIIMTYSGTASWQGKSIHEVGTATSRDELFAMRSHEVNGKWEKVLLPLEEIDLTDIQKKAHTNFLNRVIKSLLGLSFTWEELNTISSGKINQGACKGFSYAKGIKGGKVETAGAGDARQKIWGLILEMNAGDIAKAKASLAKYTSWANDPNGKSDISKVSESQLKFIMPTVQNDFDAMAKGAINENA